MMAVFVEVVVERDRVFKATKEMLRAAPVLTHFDSNKIIVFSCDESLYGVRVRINLGSFYVT